MANRQATQLLLGGSKTATVNVLWTKQNLLECNGKGLGTTVTTSDDWFHKCRRTALPEQSRWRSGTLSVELLFTAVPDAQCTMDMVINIRTIIFH
jgi:hypothetical protein